MDDIHGDLLEYGNWKDEGCELHPSCLACPLPRCIEELPRGRQKWRMQERTAAMLRLKDGGLTAREIASLYRVSVRTVQRSISGKRVA